MLMIYPGIAGVLGPKVPKRRPIVPPARLIAA